jgi:hypothetical protein
MSAAALLADLASDGIRLHRNGGELVAEVPPGASLDPYRERIRSGKGSLLMELVKAEIMKCVYVEPADFERDRYDGLWREFYALESQQEGNP